ncbi:hypothetical protein ABEB36_015694 [Hypothenemus hampei]|uniref:CCHC-type domain-containing protein n=1 Tax=Hypothenemus hampei TaxID=57062 RepID=A0ABD1DZA0_HYPHA
MNVKGKCLRCLETGHSAKTCKNQPTCYECEKAGHRAGSMMCTIYKNLVNQGRQQMIAVERQRKARERQQSSGRDNKQTLTHDQESDEAGSITEAESKAETGQRTNQALIRQESNFSNFSTDSLNRQDKI